MIGHEHQFLQANSKIDKLAEPPPKNILRFSILTTIDLQTEDNPTQTRAQDHLNRPPGFARQYIQITGKGYPREKVGEEDVDGRRYNQLVECRPI